MELASTSYEILGKDKNEIITLRFTLSSIPTSKWVSVFNSKTYNIKASNNSAYLILSTKKIEKNTLISKIESIIRNVDKDIFDETNKDQILVSSLKKGYVVVHDGLSYSDEAFQEYLNRVNSYAML